MTAGRGPDRDRARASAPTAAVDVLVVGDGGTPALDAVAALGLRVSRPQDVHTAWTLLDGLRQPAVIVVRPSAAAMALDLARVRRDRPELRAILLAAGPDASCPEGIDELIAIGLPDDEVVGRIVIHLAHARSSAPRRLPVADDTVLDLDARALRRRGRLIRLRPLESRLLEELARSPGRPLSRDWLIERAWPRVPARGSRTVDVHVRWLRQKLEPDPRRPVHLLTVRGLGYQLEPDSGPGTDADVGV
jgi:DNA-binding winged helix-turn-helix (wHTH) protein